MLFHLRLFLWHGSPLTPLSLFVCSSVCLSCIQMTCKLKDVTCPRSLIGCCCVLCVCFFAVPGQFSSSRSQRGDDHILSGSFVVTIVIVAVWFGLAGWLVVYFSFTGTTNLLEHHPVHMSSICPYKCIYASYCFNYKQQQFA